MLHVLRLHSLSWPPGGESSGGIRSQCSCLSGRPSGPKESSSGSLRKHKPGADPVQHRSAQLPWDQDHIPTHAEPQGGAGGGGGAVLQPAQHSLLPHATGEEHLSHLLPPRPQRQLLVEVQPAVPDLYAVRRGFRFTGRRHVRRGPSEALTWWLLRADEPSWDLGGPVQVPGGPEGPEVHLGEPRESEPILCGCYWKQSAWSLTSSFCPQHGKNFLPDSKRK